MSSMQEDAQAPFMTLPTVSDWSGKLADPQRRAFRFVLGRLQDEGGAGLFSEQGTGKTVISMAVLEMLRPKLSLVLVVAPLTALDVTWRHRLLTLPWHVTSDWETFKRNRKNRSPTVLLIHYEAVTKLRRQLQRIPWDMVILDEMHRTKAHANGWSRSVRLLRHAKRRLGLSGTPIDKSPIDVFAQMRFIDHTVLSDRWQNFTRAWCYRGGYMGKEWKFVPNRLPRFLEALQSHIFRLSAAFLELPPIQMMPLPIAMFGRQRRCYEEMASTGMIQELHLKADRIITRQAKLAQITCGFVIDEGGTVHSVGEAKERKLRWLRNFLDSPFVIACRFIEDLVRLKAIFPQAALLHGGVPPKRRTEIISAFQQGQLPALILQVRTGSESIELTAARDLVIYSLGHSFIDWSQLVARLQRYGQKRSVRVWLLYVSDTIDEDIIDTIERKGKQAYEIVSFFET